MYNSNEEDFKNKYFKYKAKYLELKDLLEGGIPLKVKPKDIPKDKSKDKSKDKPKVSFFDKITKALDDPCEYEYKECAKHFIVCNWDLGRSNKCIKRK